MYLKKLVLLLVLVLLVSLPVQAAVRDEISLLHEYAFSREDVNFTVSDTCTGHSCFNQVSVREDGWFATYTQMEQEESQPTSGMFSQVYIDIFDAEAQLQKEISFEYSYNVAIELMANTVDIYLDGVLISYDWETDELTAWRIPADALTTSGLYLKLHQPQFQVGEWSYRCERTYYGYATLTRENRNITEILLAYPGNGVEFGHTSVTPIVIGGCAAVLIPCISFLWRRNKKDRSSNS